MKREKRRFIACSNDGRSFVIVASVNVRREFNQHQGDYDVEDALGFLETSDGMDVSPEADGAYLILPLDILVRKS